MVNIDRTWYSMSLMAFALWISSQRMATTRSKYWNNNEIDPKSTIDAY